MTDFVSPLAQIRSRWLCTSALEVPQWAELCSALSACTDAGDVVRMLKRADFETADQVLVFLIGRAQQGDAVAAETVLQTMLPKLLCMARTGLASFQPDALADLHAAMWERIQTYPLDRRPRRVAANLALDARRAAMRFWSRNAGAREVAVELGPNDLPSVQLEPISELGDLLALATRRDWVKPEWAALVEAVYGDRGLSSEEAAAEFGLEAATVRSRCSRSLRSLRAHRDELLAA